MTLTPETSSWVSLSHPSHVAARAAEAWRVRVVPEEELEEAATGAESVRSHAPAARERPATAMVHPQRIVFPLWLAALLVAAGVKCVLLPFPVDTLGAFVRWVLRLAIITAPDAGFLAALAGAALLTSRLTPSRRGGQWWQRACVAAFALYALYAVVSLPMYRVMVVPFSIRMISFVGGPVLMWSSLQPFLSAGTVAALALLPLLVAAAPWLVRVWPRTARVEAAIIPPWCTAALLLMAAAYTAVCEGYVRRNWTDRNRWERRIAHSAHWVLVRSCLQEVASERPLAGRFSFTEIDESDFTRPRTPPPPLHIEQPRNVILIVLESCGVEYLDLYGAAYPTMPRLAEVTRQRGIVFDNLYAQATSSCKSLVSLSASVYPRPDWLLICRDSPGFSIPTLAEVLRSAGYRTCYAHAGYWSWKGRDRFLRARGVDKLIDGTAHPERRVNSWGVDDAAMYEDILHWIDEDPTRPFFVFAYTIETHHPYVAPRRPYDFGVQDAEFNRYLNAVREADRKIARFLEELKLRGLDRNTLVAITADHGESFGEHGQRMHSFCQYEQDVHVPLVLLYEGFAGQARREASIGQHIDIAPTLLHLLGIDPPQQWQGQSLFDTNRLPRAYFISVGNEVVLGVRDGPYKYSYYVDDRREELFDLSTDPKETRNLAESQPERCRGLRARVAGLVSYQRAFLARHGAQ